MGVKVDVVAHSQPSFAGEVVHGAVDVEVETRDFERSSADELILKLIGKASNLVYHQVFSAGPDGGTMVRQPIWQHEEIISYESQLTAFGGKAAPGRHSYPFSVALPPRLPPTMKEIGHGGGSCEVKYELQARLHRPGILNFDAKGKTELTVHPKPEEVPPTPVTMGPDIQKVNTCFWCFSGGSISIGFEADRSVVGRNEPISLVVVARNDSSSNVKDMNIQIKQEVKWYVRHNTDRRQRTIASIQVSGFQLDELQRASEKGQERGRSPTAIADEARSDLHAMLRAGAGKKYELVVPDDCQVTMQTSLINVRHSLVVELKTATCITSPEVWMPLRVQPNRDTSSESAAAEAVPYATAVEAEVMGESKFPVPSSAVTIEYTSSMPDPSAPEKF
ncbi:unnamed protein product [Ascophyllum nodosum]